MMTLTSAVELVLHAAEGEPCSIHVRKMPACTIGNLAAAVAYGLTGSWDYPIQKIGPRPGDKYHEVLVSEDEMGRSFEDLDGYTIHPSGIQRKCHLMQDIVEYTSQNAEQLTREELADMLHREGWL